MNARMILAILAAGTFCALISSPAFAGDGMTTTAAPKIAVQAQIEGLPVGSMRDSGTAKY